MEEQEFKTKMNELTTKFASMIPQCKVQLQYSKHARRKNLAHIIINSPQSSYQIEVWEPHSGGVFWDISPRGFTGGFV